MEIVRTEETVSYARSALCKISPMGTGVPHAADSSLRPVSARYAQPHVYLSGIVGLILLQVIGSHPSCIDRFSGIQAMVV